MEKRSKTNREIYEQKYPHKNIEQNPMLCVEAIGYLSALEEYFPNERKWTEEEITTLLLALAFELL